ncbi:MAG TPA: sigma-70 family RNA polymerase sigma factor [Acidimicrobiia bacterium]|nr:sigma-70 family RNA polymerase sigma factor [Acidimicrobiia bacterium]
MTASLDDAVLIERVVGGDHDAFTALMRRHQDRIFSVCLRMMGNRAAALDATQETFLTLYRKAGQYRAGAAVGTWLYRIAINTCYDHLRRERRRPSEPMPDYLDPVDPTATDPFTSVELAAPIAAALANLSVDFRSVVVLSDIEGFSLPEVAERLDLPIGTVKSRLFRARRQLAAELGNLSGGSGHQSLTDEL